MIDAVADAASSIGIVGLGGMSILSLGLWLRRAQKVAVYLRVAGLVAVLVGVGAVAGVVNLGRLYELLFFFWGLLPLTIV